MRSLLIALAATALSACSYFEPLGPDAAGVTDSPAVPEAAAEPALKVDIHDGDFAQIQQFTTPGGVSVWLVQEPSIPILALQMNWEAGSTADPEGLEGLADAVVYQMNEGAGDLDSLAFQTRME